MGRAIGSSLPVAVGIALSPIPITAVILLLTTPRARSNAAAFVAGWLAGLTVVGAIMLAVAGSSGASESGTPARWESWLKIALGLLLLSVAVREFRGRPRGEDEPGMPSWMRTIGKIRPPAAAGIAAALSGLNPKNLLLAIAGAAIIAQTGIPVWQQAISYAVFALVATAGVAAPLIIYLAMGQRSAGLLGGLKDWMRRNNAVVIAVLCLIIAAKLFGDAITALT